MKRIAVLAVLAAAFAVPGAQAAPGPTMAQFKALQAQLKKDEAKLTKDEKKISDLENLTNGTLGIILCENANLADAFQGTWQEIDTLATSLGKPAIFGTQTAISDGNACSTFTITRSHALPPTTSVFSALEALIAGP